MNLKLKRLLVIILTFSMINSLFFSIDLSKNATAEEANHKNDIEWQMFLNDRNHTNVANPLEIGIFDPIITWDKDYDVLSWGTTVGNFKENIEGDYFKDISHVVFIYEASEEDDDGNNKVLCIVDGGNGETMWEWYFDSEDTKTTPALAYLDDDDKLDIIFGTNNGTIYAIEPIIYYYGNEYEVTDEFELLWDKSTNGEFTESSLTVADLNNDGTDDIAFGVVIEGKSNLYALNGLKGHVIGKKELEGNLISTPVVMGDPIEYVIVTTLDTDNDRLYVYGYDPLIGEQALEEEYSAEKGRADNIVPSPTVFDLDNDDDLDIIISFVVNPDDDGISKVVALDIQKNKPEHWNDVSIKGHIGASLTIGDGKMVVQSYYYKDWPDSTTILTVLNYKGEEMWKTEYDTDSNPYVDRALASPVLADLNDDGFLDIISATTPNIVTYDGNSTKNNVKKLWDLNLNSDDEKSHTLYNSPAVCDINGDNLLDLVIDSAMVTTKIPDLYIEPVDIEFYEGENKVDIVDESDEVRIKAWVHNKGSEDSENVIVSFYDGDNKIGNDQKIKEILSGGKSFAEIVWDTAGEGGDNYIKVKVDPDNKIKEAYENNNKATKKITVREPYKVNILCENNESFQDPGNISEYEITVINEGSRSDEIEITFSESLNDNWEVWLDTETVDLTAGESKFVTLFVKPEIGTLAYKKAEVLVTGTSINDNHHPVPSSDSLTTITMVNAVYGVELSCEYNSKQVNPNKNINYKIEVKNTGNTEDIIKIQKTNPKDWTIVLSDHTLTLNAFESKIVNLKVTGEDLLVQDETASIIISGKSSNDENKTSSIETISKLSQIMCDNLVQEVFPEDKANFTIGITNFGNQKTIDLEHYGTETWPKWTSHENITLNKGEHKEIYLEVEVPKLTIPYTENDVTITGTFDDGDKLIVLKTIAKPTFKVNLSYAGSENLSINPSESAIYYIEVENEGTAPDIIDMSYVFIDEDSIEIEKPKGWSVKFEKNNVELMATQSEVIEINITASNQAIFGNHYIKIIGTSKGNSSKSDSLNLTTFIYRTFGVDLICLDNQKSINPGSSTFYTIAVKNIGNDNDIVNLTIDDSGSPEGLIHGTPTMIGDELVGGKVYLNPYEETNITLHITIVNDYSKAYAGAISPVNISGILISNLTYFKNLTTYTSVNQIYDISIDCNNNESEIFPEGIAKYSIDVENKGNGMDSVDFIFYFLDEDNKKLDKVDGWNIIIQGSDELKNLSLVRGEKTTIELKVIAPPITHKNAHEGFTVKIKVTAVSAGIEDEPKDNVIFTETSVKQVYGIELSCKFPDKNVVPGHFISYKIIVKNKGNGQDTFFMEMENIDNEDWTAEIIGNIDTITLESYNDEETIILKVLAPEPVDAHYGDEAEVDVTGKSKNGTVEESDDIYSEVNTISKISQIMCEDNEHNVDPSDHTNYNITVMNVGQLNDVSIALKITEIVDMKGEIQTGWNATLEKELVVLNAWEETNVLLNITAPPKDHENAFAGNMIFVNLSGETIKYGGRTDNIPTITTVNLVFDVELESSNQEIPVDLSNLTQGTFDITYDITIWNRGNGEAPILLSVEKVANDWEHVLIPKNPEEEYNNSAEFIIKSNDFAEASLVIKVPYKTLANTYETTIKGSPMLGDLDNFDELKLKTNVKPYYKLEFTKPSEILNIKEGESKTHIITLNNFGNSLDNISLRVSGIPSSWESSSVTINPSVFILSAFKELNITVQITVPENTKVDNVLLTFIGESQNEPDTIAEEQITVKVELLPNADIFIKSIEFSDDNPNPGDIVTITITIQNKGLKLAENILVELFVDNELSFNTSVSIPAGGSEIVKYEWKAEKGENDIKVVVDSVNLIIESDESNNELKKTIIVGSTDSGTGLLPILAILLVVIVLGLFIMQRTGKLEELTDRFKDAKITAKKEISEDEEEEDEQEVQEEDDEEAVEEEKEIKGVSIKMDDSEGEASVDHGKEEIYTSCPECSANIKVPKEEEFKCPVCSAIIKLKKEEEKEKSIFPIVTVCPSDSCNAKIKIKKAGTFECPKCKTNIIASEKGEITGQEKIFPLISNCPSCDAKFKISRSGDLMCPKCKIDIEVDDKGNIREKELEEWEEDPIFPMVGNCPSCKSKIKIAKAGMFKCPRCETGIEVDSIGFLSKKAIIFPLVTNCPSCDTKIKISKHGLIKCPKCHNKIDVDEKGSLELRDTNLEEEDLEF